MDRLTTADMLVWFVFLYLFFLTVTFFLWRDCEIFKKLCAPSAGSAGELTRKEQTSGRKDEEKEQEEVRDEERRQRQQQKSSEVSYWPEVKVLERRWTRTLLRVVLE